jgi:hypothetical protein
MTPHRAPEVALPCPFCGGTDLYTPNFIQVTCQQCLVTVRRDKWNSRPRERSIAEAAWKAGESSGYERGSEGWSDGIGGYATRMNESLTAILGGEARGEGS